MNIIQKETLPYTLYNMKYPFDNICNNQRATFFEVPYHRTKECLDFFKKFTRNPKHTLKNGKNLIFVFSPTDVHYELHNTEVIKWKE